MQIHGRDSLYSESIRDCGYGVQHVDSRVDDIQVATEEMVAARYDVLSSGHGFGAEGDGAFCYFDTVADLGVILECIPAPRRRRDPTSNGLRCRDVCDVLTPQRARRGWPARGWRDGG